MKGKIGTSTNITVQLSKNDIIRKMEIEAKKRERDARVALAKELRQTPSFEHLDAIALRKKQREENRKNH